MRSTKLLILIIQLFVFFDARAYDFISDGLCYNIVSNTKNTVEVTYKKQYSWNGSNYYVYSYSFETISIPSMVNHNGEVYTVIGIGAHAFSTETGNDWADSYRKKLKEVKIPEGIEYIYDRVFSGCDGLENICLPSSIKYIGTGAFSAYGNLKTIFISSANPPMIAQSGFIFNNECEIIVPQKSPYMKEQTWLQYESQVIEAVTFNDYGLTYNGISQAIPYINNIPSYVVEVDGNTTFDNLCTGNIEISIRCKKNQESVLDCSFNYEYNINKALLSVIIDDAEREYGENNPDFTYTLDGFVNNEDENVIIEYPRIVSKATPKSNVGEYDIIGSGGIANNYDFTFKDGKLTVSKAALIGKVNSISREYGHYNPNFTLEYEGLKNDEIFPSWVVSPVCNTSATISSPVGEYPITATAVPLNYDLTISSGILTILPAKLYVVATNKSRLYYEENPELTFYYSGFRNGETDAVVSGIPTLQTEANLESNVGQYEITISSISAPNYEIVYQPGTLTISPKTLSVQVGQYERAYGNPNPDFELQYSGFVASEGVQELKTIPTAHTPATETSGVGTYPVYVSGGEALNYTFNYSQGELNIVKADQEIIWNQDLSNLAVGQQVELLAYSTSGLPITYSIDANNICEIYSVGNKKYLDCIGEGEIQIKASQNGNENYNSTPRISKKVHIANSIMDKPILTIMQLPVGSVYTTVDWGSVYSFTLIPESDWVVNAISINGTDYTDKMDNNGTFTTPAITQNTTVIISYIGANSEISDILSQSVKVLGCRGGVKVIGADNGLDIIVYSIEGYLIKELKCCDDEVFIPLSSDNTYFVKVGSVTAKIRI